MDGGVLYPVVRVCPIVASVAVVFEIGDEKIYEQH